MIDKNKSVMSFSELIEALDHIEVDQLQSDIPANVRAELRHMKKNLSAILAFLGTVDASAEPQLRQSIRVVRQECMALHVTIAKLLLVYFFRLNVVMDSQSSTVAVAQYERLSQAICQTCQIFSPQFRDALSSAL